MYDEWKRRFNVQDNAKMLSVLLDMGNTMGGEEEMVVDEGSVVGMRMKGTWRQSQNMSTVEVTISKAPTPVSNQTFGFD